MKMVELFQMNRAVVAFVVVCGAVLSANARLTEVFTWNQVGPRPQSSHYTLLIPIKIFQRIRE
jgi:hypothetical protein